MSMRMLDGMMLGRIDKLTRDRAAFAKGIAELKTQIGNLRKTVKNWQDAHAERVKERDQARRERDHARKERDQIHATHQELIGNKDEIVEVDPDRWTSGGP